MSTLWLIINSGGTLLRVGKKGKLKEEVECLCAAMNRLHVTQGVRSRFCGFAPPPVTMVTYKQDGVPKRREKFMKYFFCLNRPFVKSIHFWVICYA